MIVGERELGGDIEQQEAGGEDGEHEPGQAAAHQIGEVDIEGGRPAYVGFQAAGRDDVVAEVVDQIGGGGVLGAGVGDEG